MVKKPAIAPCDFLNTSLDGLTEEYETMLNQLKKTKLSGHHTRLKETLARMVTLEFRGCIEKALWYWGSLEVDEALAALPGRSGFSPVTSWSISWGEIDKYLKR